MFRKLVSNRHSGFYFSLAMAALAFILCFSKVAGVVTFMVTWTSFAFTNILLSWYVMLSFHPKEVKAIASFEDPVHTLFSISHNSRIHQFVCSHHLAANTSR